MKRQRIQFIAIVLIALIWIAFRANYSDERTMSLNREVEAIRGQLDRPAALDLAKSPRVDVARVEASDGQEDGILLHVVDSGCGDGVQASIQIATRLLHTNRFGCVELPAETMGRRVKVRAQGYVSVDCQLTDARSQTCEIHGRLVSRVRVVDRERRPIPSIDVIWKRVPTVKSGAVASPIATTTGADGIAALRTGTTRQVTITGADARAQRSAVVYPGETVELVYPSGVFAIRLVLKSDENEGLGGVEVVIDRQSDLFDIPRSVVTDELGRIWVAQRDAGLVLSIVDWAMRFSRDLPAPWRRLGPRRAAVDDPLALWTSEEIILPVESSRARVRIVDQSTGSAILGVVRVAVERRDRGRSWDAKHFLQARNRDGVVDLPAIAAEERDSGRLSVVIWPAGYVPRVEDHADVFLAPRDSEHLLAFDPLPLRWIKLLKPDGSPLRSTVSVGSVDHRVAYLEGPLDSQGRTGPFGWAGGDVHIWRTAGGDGNREEGSIERLAVVAGSELSGNEEVTIEVELSVGTLRVMSVPDQCLLVVRDARGVLHRPSTRVGSTVAWSGLSEGRAWVGTECWVAQGWSRSHYGDAASNARIRHEGDSTMEFDPRWSLVKGIDGRIEASEATMRSMILVPVYETVDVPLPMVRTLARIPVDLSGRYTIPVGAARPEALLVCVSASGGRGAQENSETAVIAVVSPGGVARLDAGDIVLEAPRGRSDDAIHISWTAAPPTSFLPAGSKLAVLRARTRRAAWIPGERIVLPAILAGRTALTLRDGMRTWTELVDVSPRASSVHKID